MIARPVHSYYLFYSLSPSLILVAFHSFRDDLSLDLSLFFFSLLFFLSNIFAAPMGHAGILPANGLIKSGDVEQEQPTRSPSTSSFTLPTQSKSLRNKSRIDPNFDSTFVNHRNQTTTTSNDYSHKYPNDQNRQAGNVGFHLFKLI